MAAGRLSWILLAAAGALTAATPAARAADASCDRLFKVRSQNSDVATSITFVNGASTMRAILWLGFDGQPKDYASLQVGEQVTLQTYLTHPWMVATGPGDCLEIVMPVAGGSVVTLFDEGSNSGEEGVGQTSCPAGTVPVPETDNCLPSSSSTGSARLPMYGRSLGGIMRKRPDTASSRIASLRDGDRIEILEDTGIGMDGYTWFKIRAKGRTGYQWGGILCSDAALDGSLEVCK